MAEIIIKVILLAVLLFSGIQDIRKKKIYLWAILAGAIAIGVCLPFCQTVSLVDRVEGAAIGATVILISYATIGKIGMGDAFLLCVTGLGLGFWGNLELFGIALLLAAIVSIVLLTFRLADRKKSIPFVPFMLASYLFLIYVGR